MSNIVVSSFEIYTIPCSDAMYLVNSVEGKTYEVEAWTEELLKPFEHFGIDTRTELLKAGKLIKVTKKNCQRHIAAESKAISALLGIRSASATIYQGQELRYRFWIRTHQDRLYTMEIQDPDTVFLRFTGHWSKNEDLILEHKEGWRELTRNDFIKDLMMRCPPLAFLLSH